MNRKLPKYSFFMLRIWFAIFARNSNDKIFNCNALTLQSSWNIVIMLTELLQLQLYCVIPSVFQHLHSFTQQLTFVSWKRSNARKLPKFHLKYEKMGSITSSLLAYLAIFGSESLQAPEILIDRIEFVDRMHLQTISDWRLRWNSIIIS